MPSSPSFLHNAHVLSLNATIHGKQIMGGGGGFFFGSADKVVAPGMNNALFHVVYQPDKPLLAAPTHRNRPLRRPRRNPDPRRGLVDTPAHLLIQ